MTESINIHIVIEEENAEHALRALQVVEMIATQYLDELEGKPGAMIASRHAVDVLQAVIDSIAEGLASVTFQGWDGDIAELEEEK